MRQLVGKPPTQQLGSLFFPHLPGEGLWILTEVQASPLLSSLPPQAPNAAAWERMDPSPIKRSGCSWACMGPNNARKNARIDAKQHVRLCQTECQTENVRLLEYMPDRMPDRMSAFVSDRTSLGGDHSKKVIFLGRLEQVSQPEVSKSGINVDRIRCHDILAHYSSFVLWTKSACPTLFDDHTKHMLRGSSFPRAAGS